MDADAVMVGDAVVVGEEEQRDGYMLRAFCNAIHQSVFEASAYFGSALRVPATLN